MFFCVWEIFEICGCYFSFDYYFNIVLFILDNRIVIIYEYLLGIRYGENCFVGIFLCNFYSLVYEVLFLCLLEEEIEFRVLVFKFSCVYSNLNKKIYICL